MAMLLAMHVVDRVLCATNFPQPIESLLRGEHFLIGKRPFRRGLPDVRHYSSAGRPANA
jgi:hypothetical protein